jgi:hypothetical protein
MFIFRVVIRALLPLRQNCIYRKKFTPYDYSILPVYQTALSEIKKGFPIRGKPSKTAA